MRLDKFLANQLPYSRREAVGLIKKKQVSVNGVLALRGDIHIDENHDQIVCNGQEVFYRPYLYLMLNKPAGYVSATEDKKFPTVIDLVPKEWAHFDLFPVGRLDIDTEGLLILTNDGQLAHEMLSPKKHVYKVYYAVVEGQVTQNDVEQMRMGVVLDDGYHTLPAKLVIVKSGPISEIELTICEGKFHQVKRMFEAVGKRVTYLKRIAMGGVKLDQTLPLGKARALTNQEVDNLTKREELL